MAGSATNAPPQRAKSAKNEKKAITTHFLVHGKQDSVGVMAADVTAGQQCTGWNMETDDTVSIKANGDIPLGHKIALVDLAEGTPLIKYGCPIGKVTKAIKKGDHVHTHNLKTARW
jgi:(2R)-sulfolactate sulfo-lyase subunit alpha